MFRPVSIHHKTVSMVIFSINYLQYQLSYAINLRKIFSKNRVNTTLVSKKYFKSNIFFGISIVSRLNKLNILRLRETWSYYNNLQNLTVILRTRWQETGNFPYPQESSLKFWLRIYFWHFFLSPAVSSNYILKTPTRPGDEGGVWAGSNFRKSSFNRVTDA